jgi:hypothetical protein
MGTFFADRTSLTFDRRKTGYSVLSKHDRQHVVVDDMVFDVNSMAEIKIRAFTGDRWPGGEVFFEFASGLNTTMKSQFKKACKEWSSVSKVKFTPRTGQDGYIYVENGSVNQSSVGYNNVRRLFEITSWSNHIIIAHELGHTLGLSHEHCRSDRDTYVKIHLDNIPDDKEGNFKKRATENYSSYDFESIMHYSRFAFAQNTSKPTISAKSEYEAKEGLMGNRGHLSSSDKADMAARYGKL